VPKKIRDEFAKLSVLLAAHVHTANSLSSIKFSDRVYCTKNFFRGIEKVVPQSSSGRAQQPSLDILNNYLRPVDAAWLFNNGDILLLSEREADEVSAGSHDFN